MQLKVPMRQALLALGCLILASFVTCLFGGRALSAPASGRYVVASGFNAAESTRNVANALTFWSEWLKTKGLDKPNEYIERTTSREIGEDIKAAISADAKQSSRTLRILDAGAGPLTSLGNRWPGKDVEVRACDALAREFDRLLDRYHIVPPVRTIRAEFETLRSTFPENHFDMVHIRNALDHAHDPVKGISEAIAVTRMHGVVYMTHALRSAIMSGNKGLHVWNFDLVDGHPVMWNCRRAHNLSELFGDEAQITHNVTGGWINIQMLRVA